MMKAARAAFFRNEDLDKLFDKFQKNKDIRLIFFHRVNIRNIKSAKW